MRFADSSQTFPMSAKSHQEKFGGQKDSPKPSPPCGQMPPTLRELPKKEGYDIGARACHCRSKGMDWKNYSSYRLPGGCRRIDGRYHLISQQDFILHLQFWDFASESADALRKLCKGLRWAVVSDT